MVEKLTTKIKNLSALKRYFTFSGVGSLVIAVVALSVAWASVKVIQRNYLLLKQIAVLEQQVQIDKDRVDNQRLQNEYYQTDTYLEIAARRDLNKALPGEKLLIIPKEIANAKLPPIASAKETEAPKSNPTNWQAWISFLTGRAVETSD